MVRRDDPAVEALDLIGAGRYAQNLYPFWRSYGERLLIVVHDDIRTDPAKVYEQVLTHIGVTTDFTPSRLERVLYSNAHSRWVAASMPDDEQRRNLAMLFRNDVEELEAMLGRALTAWDPGPPSPGWESQPVRRASSPPSGSADGRAGRQGAPAELLDHRRAAERDALVAGEPRGAPRHLHVDRGAVVLQQPRADAQASPARLPDAVRRLERRAVRRRVVAELPAARQPPRPGGAADRRVVARRPADRPRAPAGRADVLGAAQPHQAGPAARSTPTSSR